MESIPLLSERLRIGRALDNEILLQGETSVSRYHAEIRREGEQWILEDMNTRNGSQVNGHRVLGSVALSDGCRLQIGNAEFVFRDT